MFWQSLARYFMLLWIDWGKQAPSAEQLPRRIRQQKPRSPISKLAPSSWAPKRCRKNNFPPARGCARAPASATTGWTTLRFGALQEGNTNKDIGLGVRKSLLLSVPPVPRPTSYMMGPSFPPSSFTLYVYGRSFSRQWVPLIWGCAVVHPREPNLKCAPTWTIMYDPNLKWCGKRPAFLVENYSSDLSSVLKPLCVW